MRIKQIEAIPVRVPLAPGMTTRTAHGEHHTSDYVIVKVHTDDGLDRSRRGNRLGPLERRDQQEHGRGDPRPDRPGAGRPRSRRRITAARKEMDFLIKLNPFTKAAVEMALWDISRQGRRAAGLSASGRQAAGHDPDQDDDRGLRRSPRPVAGRAIPGLGLPLLEGESRARPGRRPGPGAGRPRGRRAGRRRSRSTPIAAGT